MCGQGKNGLNFNFFRLKIVVPEIVVVTIIITLGSSVRSQMQIQKLFLKYIYIYTHMVFHALSFIFINLTLCLAP